MTINMYSVYDSKAKAYALPWFADNHEVAIRAFSTKINRKDNELSMHPEDYTLFCVGSFDTQTAELTPLVPNDTLGKAIEYVSKNGN